MGGGDRDTSSNDGAVVVVEQAGVIILDGPSQLVAELVANDPVLREAGPVQVSGGVAAGALAQIADLAGGSNTQQVVFQLDDKGMQMYRQGTLVSQGDGWMRAFGKAADGTFSGQAAIKPLMLAPEQILTAQLAVTTVALTAAIREVQEAVERVEQKVDVLNDLVVAGLVGGVLGAHRSLRRRAEQHRFTGTLSDTDWQAIDSLGVQVEQQIETLRAFIRKRMQAAIDEGARIGDRRDAISHIFDLSESLTLLTIAQDNLFMFEQLRLVRIRDKEPHLLQGATAEATALLAGQRHEDTQLLAAVRDLVVERVEVKALEIHRFMSARSVVQTAASVDESLASFSEERRLEYIAIPIPALPHIADAVDELKSRGASLTRGARSASEDLLRRGREEFDQLADEPLGSLEGGTDTATDPVDPRPTVTGADPAAPTSSSRSRSALRAVGNRASSWRHRKEGDGG